MILRRYIFPEYGRLGNQLFQYFGLRAALHRNEIAHLVGFGSLTGSFRHLEHPSLRIHSTEFRVVSAVLRRASTTRFSVPVTVEEPLDPRRMSSRAPRVIRRAFHQTQSVLCLGARSNVDFAPHVYKRAYEILANLQLTGSFSTLHIRTGDYRVWPSAESPAVLPDGWIDSAVERLREASRDMPILVVGSDGDDVRAVAGRLDLRYAHESEAVDMCILSLAKCGVLSASTFALWGANFARSKHGAPGPWFAPEYGAGIRLGRWVPEHLFVDWLTYLPVSEFLDVGYIT